MGAAESPDYRDIEVDMVAGDGPGERGKVMIRRAYIRKVEDQLARLEYDIEHLQNRTAKPESDVRSRIDREIPGLRSKAAAVRERIHAVEGAGASNWGRLKYAVDEGLKDLRQIVDEAVERLRKTGSGER